MTQGKPAVVVLAGGRGVRIGGGKPDRLLGGISLLERALDQARRWSDRVAVAGEGVTANAPVIADDPGMTGPLGGLASALGFAAAEGADSLITIPCDTPFLPDDLPARLRSALGSAACALPTSAGRFHPACGLWRTNLSTRLKSYAGEGGRSLTGFAEATGFALTEWGAEPFDPFFNINTQADLAVAEAILRRRGESS